MRYHILRRASGAPSTTPSSLLQDWLYAIGQFGNNPYADGVVWHHDFEFKAEVDKFRWTGQFGNDPDDTGPRPNTVRWNSSGGVTHGCLEIYRAPGFDDPSNWWRQFSPLNGASNGRGVDDPAAGGTIPLKSFSPVADGNQTASWVGGYYGDQSYHAANPGMYDGTEYYIRVRMKMDGNRIAGANENGGKILFLTLTSASNTRQEINTVSGNRRGSGATLGNYFDMYRSGSGGMDQDSPGVSVHGNHPGTEYGTIGDGVCRYDDNGGRLGNCWKWPPDKWVTFLYHGRTGTGVIGQQGDGDPNTLLEVFVCEEDETAYTQIWSQGDIPLPFEVLQGHNAVIASGYQNGAQGVVIDTAFTHKYCQWIFSKRWIPPPQVPLTETPLTTLLASMAPGEVSTSLGDTGLGTIGNRWINWQSPMDWDLPNGFAIWVGKQENQHNTRVGILNLTGGTTNAWNVATIEGIGTGGPFLTTRGHSWHMPVHDYETGDTYYLENGGNIHRIAKHTAGDPPGVWTFFGENPETKGCPANMLATGTPRTFIGTSSTAMALMPNLFGPGDKGLLIGVQFGWIAYRFSTGLYQVVMDRATWTSLVSLGQDSPAALYVRGADCAVFSLGEATTGNEMFKVTNGPVLTQLPNAPMRITHDHAQPYNGLKIVDDPDQGAKFYGFEHVEPKRVFVGNISTGLITIASGFTHPFGVSPEPDNFVVGPIYWRSAWGGVEANGLNLKTKFWKKPTGL